MGFLSIIIQLVLGIVFLIFGFVKFDAKKRGKDFERYGYPQWFRIVSGVIEIIAAILAIYGIVNQTAAAWSGVVISVIMVGAIFTQIKIRDPLQKILMPVVILILGMIILALNWQFILGQ
ncbi:DoxX family protein [Carnobacterium sp.]|uniref:DoxX family protein n=1 Tax=Carnobacterium sp. TaxID=48221 RepID=UPI0028A6B7E4|nr:DoxX family protein [Carnobacterium sp.]